MIKRISILIIVIAGTLVMAQAPALAVPAGYNSNCQYLNEIIRFILVILLLAVFSYCGLKNKWINNKLEVFYSFLEKIDKIKISAGLWIISYLSITLIRDFLENFIECPTNMLSWMHHFEFSLFWFALFFTITIFLKIISKEDISKVSKLVIFGWLITLIPPIIDSIVSFGKPFNMGYIPHNTFANYITFFGLGRAGFGATIGIKIEILLGSLIAAIYIASKTKSWIKSFISLIGMYSICFFYMSIPSIAYNVLRLLGFAYTLRYPVDLVIILLSMIIILSPIYLLLYKKSAFVTFLKEIGAIFDLRRLRINRKILVTLLKNIRPFRAIHYSILVLLGIFIGVYHSSANFTDISFLHIIFLLSSITFGWLFAIGINDMFDVKIDERSNKNRPLIQKSISFENYKMITLLFFVFAILFSSFVSYYSANIILYFMLAYSFIYSAPPFRLRKYFSVPNIIIGLCSLYAVLLGFSLTAGIKTFKLMPKNIALLVFIGFTLASTIKDLKDVKEDKAAGITTIPTLFGLKNAKKIIGFLLAFSFMLPLIFLKLSCLWFYSIFFATIAFIFAIKKDEKYIFVLWFIFAILLILSYK